VELRDYLRIIQKRGWIILVVAIVAAAVAVGVSQVQTPVYKATIQISVEPARLDWGLSNVIKDIMRSYVVRLTSHSMAQEVINRAQLDMNTDELKGIVTVSSDSSNYTMQIDAKSPDPILAREIVSTMAAQFVDEREAWNQDQDQRDRVVVTIVDEPRDAILHSPKTKTNALAGLIFGAIVGALVIFIIEWLESDIVRTPDDVERTVGWTVLGTIPVDAEQRSGRRKKASIRRAG
jgi:capsular polysaccharide biosynthesis protein